MSLNQGKAYSPWEHAEILGVPVETQWLRGRRWGEYHAGTHTIRLDRRLLRVEARSILAHEVQHAIHRDVPSGFGPVDARMERRARLNAALLLVDPHEYAEAEALCDGADCGIAHALDVIPEVLADWRMAVRTVGVRV